VAGDSHGGRSLLPALAPASPSLAQSVPTETRLFARPSSASPQVKPDDVCAICLEALKPQQTVLDLTCKHDFHKGCILKWLKQSEVSSAVRAAFPLPSDTHTCGTCRNELQEGNAHPTWGNGRPRPTRIHACGRTLHLLA
jgi:hypothetical protein